MSAILGQTRVDDFRTWPFSVALRDEFRRGQSAAAVLHGRSEPLKGSRPAMRHRRRKLAADFEAMQEEVQQAYAIGHLAFPPRRWPGHRSQEC